jgi:hypothetical protein
VLGRSAVTLAGIAAVQAEVRQGWAGALLSRLGRYIFPRLGRCIRSRVGRCLPAPAGPVGLHPGWALAAAFRLGQGDIPAGLFSCAPGRAGFILRLGLLAAPRLGSWSHPGWAGAVPRLGQVLQHPAGPLRASRPA